MCDAVLKWFKCQNEAKYNDNNRKKMKQKKYERWWDDGIAGLAHTELVLFNKKV